MEEALDIDEPIPLKISSVATTDKAPLVPVSDPPGAFGLRGTPVTIGRGESENSVETLESQINSKNLSSTTSRIVLGRAKDVTLILKLFPSKAAPIAIADAIHAIKLRTKTARNNTHYFLRDIGPLWNDEEKDRFVLRIAEKGCQVDLATVMLDIAYTEESGPSDHLLSIQFKVI
jgi:hypothetical protein